MTESDPTQRGAELPAELGDALFAQVFLVPPAQRRGVIEDFCARHPWQADALRRLANDALLADQALAEATADPAAAEPTAVAGMPVVRRLGAGAFGVVYLCEQQQPLRREVAVKVLRPGAGTRRTLLRFAAERQVLARMSHPAIAQVFDAGELPDGRPYFVMEHVPGAPLTTWCRDLGLEVEARLDLFLHVCEGVAHAHQRGIIHRDLKPSNVLVSGPAAQPQPKIIDFGLAKALHGEAGHGGDAAGEDRTEAGRVLGTPGYMSPEQAAGRSDDIDVRTDVFALGVLLYALLTDSLPWDDPGDPRRAPVRPSTRVLSGGSAPALERRRLSARLRADLDWIVLRAIEPDRNRRYQSVAEFAADIGRHLRHEPVQAGPPSIAYRLRKFVRRHRLGVTTAAAIAISLLAGLSLAFTYALDARANLQRFEILALGPRLALARTAAAALQPPWPERLPDFDRWLREHGEPLAQELPRLQAALADLRATALAPNAALDAADRQAHPLTAAIDEHAAMIDYLTALLAHRMLQRPEYQPLRQNLEAVRQQRSATRAELEAQRAGAQRWHFAAPPQQFLHDTIERLHDDLEGFVAGEQSVLGRIRTNRIQIQAIEVDGLVPWLPAWERTAAEVLAEPRYQGLRLVPQAGLVPLGRDPDSNLQEFYHRASAPADEPVPMRDPGGVLRLGEYSGIVVVLVPGGVTRIGAQRDDPGAPHYDPDAAISESPVHEVELAPFLIGKHEVTQQQWLQLTGTLPSHLHRNTATTSGRAITGRHPVENVTWDEAMASLAAQGFVLPTEAQWEHACRAGTATIWFVGDDPAAMDGHAQLADRSARGGGHTTHAPVGSYGANGFGLHDMIGNVAEWCADPFSSLAYLLPARAGDGMRPVPAMQVRVVRGGSYQNAAREGASAARSPVPHNQRGSNVGVRVARPLRY